MSVLSKIAVKRLSIFPMDEGQRDEIQAGAFRLEIGELGYFVKNPEKFTTVSPEAFQNLVEALEEMRGGNVTYIPLFTGFPEQLPNDSSYFLRRVLGFIGLDTFDLSKFGANPITQMQNEALWQWAASAQQKRLGDTHIESRPLTFVSEAEMNKALLEWCLLQFYSATSVKEALWEDLFAVLNQLQPQVDMDRVMVKETLARLALRQWDSFGTITLKTPTDLLRMFAVKMGQDISLAKPVSLTGLKLSKPNRRTIVGFLNSCSSLEEDLLRYKGLWLSLALFLHPGDLAKQYPRVARAFDDLRNDRLKSFEARVLALSGTERSDALLSRPSVFLRKLTLLLKEVEPEALAERICSINPEEVPLPLLMTVFSALKYRGIRVVINKKGKSYVLKETVPNQPPSEEPLPQSLKKFIGLVGEPKQAEEVQKSRRLPVLKTLDNLILCKLKGTKDWKTVWIDPVLFKVVLPFQARKQSDGLLPLARGSRLQIPPCEVIRLFVYWQENTARTDLDLSCMKLNRQFQYVDHVGWNSYGDGIDVAHSGDTQSAPLGAAEFIDIRLNYIRDSYLMPVIVHYTGNSFTEMKACYAGWMHRDEFGTDTKTFDAKTVALKVNVNQDGKTWCPFLLDVNKQEIIYVDLYSAGKRTIEANKHFPDLARAFSLYNKARPTFGQLAHWYARANGCKIVSREVAEVSIGIDDLCTINVFKLVGEGVTSFS